MSDEQPTTYWERRRAGEFERVAEERAQQLAIEQAQTPYAVAAPDERVHIPIGSDVELDDAIDTGGGGGGSGASSLTDLTDVTGTPGPGKSPVDDGTSTFELTRVTTEDDLSAVLARVAGVEWHDIGAPGEPPFQSSFRNIGEPWSPLRYRLLANSTVRLQGTICCDDATLTDAMWIPICQLPPEIAPSENLEFATLTNDASFSRMYVWADGTLVWGGYVSAPHAPISRLPLNFLSWSTAGAVASPTNAFLRGGDAR